MPVVERAENCEGPAVAALFKVADVPVVQVVMVPPVLCGCVRPCDHTATSSCLFNSGGASDSVHRQSRGHSRCATETGTQLLAEALWQR